MIDTHAHIYLDAFEEDHQEMIDRLIAAGVEEVYLPNIDLDSIPQIHKLVNHYPTLCKPMMGLHPCSVKDNWKAVLEQVRIELDKGGYVAVGEIGLDAYWDKSTLPWQEEALRTQIHWAVDRNLPIVLHTRDTMDRCIAIVSEEIKPGLSGIFHCFNGTADQARRIVEMGFYLGIGGVYTFKKAQMDQHLADIPLDYLVLETDTPYLAPVPHRGKRNEPAYLQFVAEKLALDRTCSIEEVIRVTDRNARAVFQQIAE